MGEEGNLSWDRETTGMAQMGRGIQSDVCYHVECNEAKHQVEAESGQGEVSFSLCCWRAGSRTSCVISRLPPVWSESKLSACCAACFQGWSGTAGLQLPAQPAGRDEGSAGDHCWQWHPLWCGVAPSALLRTLTGGKPGAARGLRLHSTLLLWGTLRQCLSWPLPLPETFWLCREDEGGGGVVGIANYTLGAPLMGTSLSSRLYRNTECEIANPQSVADRSSEGFRSVI